MSGQPGQKSGGRNRKSRATLQLAHTYRRDRHDDQAATTPERRSALSGAADGADGIPAAPEDVSLASQALWRAFNQRYVLDPPQCEALASGLKNRDLAEAIYAALQRDGLTVTGRHGQVRSHPLLAAHRDARAGYLAVLRMLGLLEPEVG